MQSIPLAVLKLGDLMMDETIADCMQSIPLAVLKPLEYASILPN